jgi:hypothetical protein
MRKTALTVLGAFVCTFAASLVVAQTPTSIPRITLYSPNKYSLERRISCLKIQPEQSGTHGAQCDVRYGNLWAGDELDWFQSATGQDDRSVIRDLGAYEWTANFQVPVVAPLPKLKAGEQRRITVDTSGADGADGKPGEDGVRGENGVNGDLTVTPSRDLRGPLPEKPTPLPAKTKRDGKPKVDPVFAKAVPGHMYLIHVVDDTRDFYALFRVESLKRGDNCTISWKLISAPKAQ